MCRLALLLAAAGCGAELGGGGTQVGSEIVDASVQPDAVVMPDARPCTGTAAPDGSCFVFVNTPVTYAAAKLACTNMNAHLAYLKTAALDTAAEAMIGTTNTWIGASDLATEGTFLWDDGSALAFTNWHAGEPNAGGPDATYQEDCVIIAGARVDKQWDDRPCDASEVANSGVFAYLCQY